MLDSSTDRLLASRVYSALAWCCFHVEDTIGAEEAIRLAVEYAGDSPTEELAFALSTQSQYLNRHGRFAESVEAAQRAIDAARSAGSVEAEMDALYPGSLSLLLPRPHRRRTRGDGAGRGPGTGSGHGRVRSRRVSCPWSTWRPGRSIVACPSPGSGFEEALALGLPVQASLCGGAAMVALLWRGRLDEAEQRFEELGELGLPAVQRALALAARGAVGWRAVTRTRRPPWSARPRPRRRQHANCRSHGMC